MGRLLSDHFAFKPWLRVVHRSGGQTQGDLQYAAQPATCCSRCYSYGTGSHRPPDEEIRTALESILSTNEDISTVVFYGFFLVIEAHGGTWFQYQVRSNSLYIYFSYLVLGGLRFSCSLRSTFVLPSIYHA